MDNKNNILDDEIEVLDFFDDEEEISNSQETQVVQAETLPVENMSTNSKEEQLIDNVNQVSNNSAEPTMISNVDPTTEIEPVMPTVEAAPVEPTMTSSFDPTPEIEPVMPTVEAAPVEPTMTSNVDPTPEIEPVMPTVEAAPVEPTMTSNVELTPEIEPVMPTVEAAPVEPTMISNVDPTPEIEPVMPTVEAAPVEPTMTSNVDLTPEIEPAMSTVEVPSFSGFEVPNTQPQVDAVPTFTGFDTGVSEDYTKMMNENPSNMNTGDLNYSAFDVDDGQSQVPTYTTTIPPMEPAPVATTPEEKEVLKEVEASTPTNINDQILKVEDTLSSNNLKEEIKAETHKDESQTNKKAIIFVVTIFVVLGILILLLPQLMQVLKAA